MFRKRSPLLILVLLALFAVQSALAAPANTINVAAGVVVIDGGDGQCSLKEAIDNANDTADGQPHADCTAGNVSGADTLSLASGSTYTLTSIDNGNTGLPAITSDVTVVGNGATIERALTAPLFRLLEVAVNGSLDISDITLQNGSADPSLPQLIIAGGAIYVEGNLSVSDALFHNNRSPLGGAIGFDTDTDNIARALHIQDTTFTDNDATSNGGALYIRVVGVSNFDLMVTIAGSDFHNNDADSSGGAFYTVGNATNCDVEVEINDSEFFSNESEHTGGAIFSLAHEPNLLDVTINDTLFDGNRAIAGGAIANFSDSEMAVERSTLRNNIADVASAIVTNRGGAVFNSGTLTVDRSVMHSNSAEDSGGALFNEGIALVEHTTISGNSATNFGGGILNESDTTNPASLNIHFSTIVNNVAADGGGLSNRIDGTGGTEFPDTDIGNTIIFANQAAGLGALDCDLDGGTITSLGNNLKAGSALSGCSALNLPSDQSAAVPAMELDLTLSDNGGPTLTHALPATSLARDGIIAANGIPCVSGTTIDQRILLRANGGDTGTRCDIGAYEFGATMPPTAIRLTQMSAQTPILLIWVVSVMMLMVVTRVIFRRV